MLSVFRNLKMFVFFNFWKSDDCKNEYDFHFNGNSFGKRKETYVYLCDLTNFISNYD